ncbi:hypothetical protein HDU88_001598 [Geranomyces variabilis]|nr:hypothetical protein HDU88_001598 [Geranomyces variabilis]
MPEMSVSTIEKPHTAIRVDGQSNEENLEKGIKRQMKSRHIAMISIGGTIGTGLFVASGGPIYTAGPAGALIAYGFMGFTLFCLMTALGEMATLIPITGSFNHYAGRFVDPAFGFAMYWNYFFGFGTCLATELAASGVIIGYWKKVVPEYVWSLLILVLIVFFNMFGGRGYGEMEYWLSLIKIMTVIIFIIVGTLVAAGALGGHTYGFENWTNPGAFVSDGPDVYSNAFANICSTMMIVGFSYMGTELVGIAAGETANPTKSVPKAIRNVFWRILIFFLCSVFIIGLVVPSSDPRLHMADQSQPGIAPFTIVFQTATIKGAAGIINGVLLTVIISASNSALYCGSRTMMAMAREGMAPRIFGRVNSHGVPIPAIAITSCFGLIVAAASAYTNAVVFNWVLALSGISGFITWAGLGWTHWRFRRAYVAQGRDVAKLPFRAWAYPFSSLWGAIVTTLIAATYGFTAFTPEWNVVTFFQAYINIFLFFVAWFGYKIVKKTKIVPLLSCDFETGARWVDPNAGDEDEETPQ